MKKIILLIIILIFLTGCSYNLNYFVMPDDLEFLVLVEELDTPQKIGNYMLENFTYELHILWTPTPYILWKTKKGDCNDFATFGVFIADYHGYETWLIEIYWKNTIERHWLAIYKENEYSFSDNWFYFPAIYNDFLEIVEYDSFLQNKDWTKYIVYGYWDNEVEVRYND